MCGTLKFETARLLFSKSLITLLHNSVDDTHGSYVKEILKRFRDILHDKTIVFASKTIQNETNRK